MTTTTPSKLRSYADDADQHGNHWVPIAPATLRGLADALEASQRQRDELMRCWFVLKDAGLHPGRTDDALHEVLRRVLPK